MTNDPLVSIIINNYNYSEFIREAIDSALNQTYPNTEVIVVDDGSTDNSQEIIASYGTQIVPLLKKNGGQASALNAGFRFSKGGIIIFLDADDYLFAHAVEQVIAVWKPNVANVQYRLEMLEMIDDQRKFTGVYPVPEIRLDSGDVLPILLLKGRYSCLVTSGNAFNREALTAILPITEEKDSSFRNKAEAYIVTLIPFYGQIVSIEQPLGVYRKHRNNGWASSGKSIQVEQFCESIKHDLEKYKILADEATELGYTLTHKLGWQDYLHLQSRIASLRLDPQNHPIFSDSVLVLAYKGYWATWKYAEFNWKRKLIVSTWFLWVGLLPQPIAKSAISWVFALYSRPKAIDWVVKKIRWLSR